MNTKMLFLTLALVGCGNSPSETRGQFLSHNIDVWRDDKSNVTCWVVTTAFGEATSISCLPDSALKVSK